MTFTETIDILGNECFQFFHEAGGKPLFSRRERFNPDTHINSLNKVKLRHKRNKSGQLNIMFTETFETAILVRALSANGYPNEQWFTEHTEPCYVFPIDGYDFIYNPTIINKEDTLSDVFALLFDVFGEDDGVCAFQRLLEVGYYHEHLVSGMESGAEILIYNIPYFYTMYPHQLQNFPGSPSYEQLVNHLHTRWYDQKIQTR